MWKLKDLDGIVQVQIDGSDMLTILTLNEDSRLKEPLPIDVMLEYLRQHQVVYGLNEPLLSLICARPFSYIGQQIEIAKGIEPVDGENAKIEWIILQENESKKPKVLEDGRVDYYSVNSIINVRKGELIARKIPSTKGEQGKTVRGNNIPAKPGKDTCFRTGKNVVLNETKDKLYAAKDGQLLIQDKIHVLPIYEVNGDVDFSVGNIDFIGNVIVRGNVLDGFKIHATEDITIYGHVEGAEITSDGQIEIHQGVIGHNKSKIKATKSVKALFIKDGNIYAGESVRITQSIMQSEVRAGNEVICEGTKGLIVGGRINAGKRIIASIIGNQLATPTIIEVGMNPLLREELSELQVQIRENYQSLDKVKKALHLIERLQRTTGSLSPDKKKLQIELLDQQLLNEKRIKELGFRETEIESEMNHVESSSIEVRNVIYPGVKIMVGKYRKFIKDKQTMVKFILEEGEIKQV
ncbi:FapA family protein [Tepidibacillus marianensis]|uniref:DUF342 domain-containing protein n=1 Tax=Tepidibacillus marianensis TaxID=3131995 RepID=UPI0030D3ED67